MKKQLLLFMMMLLPMVVNADQSGTCGNNVTWNYEEAKMTLTITGKGPIDDYSRSSGSDSSPWSKYRDRIKDVVIDAGVTSIGGYAFASCINLTSVTIPNSVTCIGANAFVGCSSLASVAIPNSVTSIGFGTFQNCSGLTSIIIPNSVSYIGDYAFNNTAWYNSQPDGVVYAGLVAYKFKGTMPDNTSITKVSHPLRVV